MFAGGCSSSSWAWPGCDGSFWLFGEARVNGTGGEARWKQETQWPVYGSRIESSVFLFGQCVCLSSVDVVIT
jgi:hypothetical protein